MQECCGLLLLLLLFLIYILSGSGVEDSGVIDEGEVEFGSKFEITDTEVDSELVYVDSKKNCSIMMTQI